MRSVEKGMWRKELIGCYVESIVVTRLLGKKPAFLGIKLLSEDKGVSLIYKGSRLYSLLKEGSLKGEDFFLNFTHSPETLLKIFTSNEVEVDWNSFPPKIEKASLIVRASIEDYEIGEPIKVFFKLWEEWIDEDAIFPLTRVTGLVIEALIELSRLKIGEREVREKNYRFFEERLLRIMENENLLKLLSKAKDEARN